MRAEVRQQRRKAFGEVLQQLRWDRQLSQEQLAAASGRHRTFISFMERGIMSPTLDTLFDLSVALSIRPSELIRETEARYAKNNIEGGTP